MNAPVPTPHGSVCEAIEAEMARATSTEILAYLDGASRDGTFNRLHRTFRISQADARWLDVLGSLLARVGRRSWTYREGMRGVWVLETTWHPQTREVILTPGEGAAFVRGYFDAEGGVPTDSHARFYIQFVQKNRTDLIHVRGLVTWLGVRCGRVHNPSARHDPDYWRFYVRSVSHEQFVRTVGSWHPRKRTLLDERSLSPSIVRRAR
jgi:hypothetical protein